MGREESLSFIEGPAVDGKNPGCTPVKGANRDFCGASRAPPPTGGTVVGAIEGDGGSGRFWREQAPALRWGRGLLSVELYR